MKKAVGFLLATVYILNTTTSKYVFIRCVLIYIHNNISIYIYFTITIYIIIIMSLDDKWDNKTTYNNADFICDVY